MLILEDKQKSYIQLSAQIPMQPKNLVKTPLSFEEGKNLFQDVLDYLKTLAPPRLWEETLMIHQLKSEIRLRLILYHICGLRIVYC